MKEILLDAQELLVKWEKANPLKKQNWSDRQSSLNDSWSECRPTIFKSLLQSSFAVLEDVICQKCMCEVAALRCQECSTTTDAVIKNIFLTFLLCTILCFRRSAQYYSLWWWWPLFFICYYLTLFLSSFNIIFLIIFEPRFICWLEFSLIKLNLKGEELLKHYFDLGLSYSEIWAFLAFAHGIHFR